MNQALQALTPLDGRYQRQTADLQTYFSESALITARIQVEVFFLQYLSQQKIIRSFTSTEKKNMQALREPSLAECQRVKELEQETKHDVKAVEYFLREKVPADVISYLHFGLTSEDVNNLAYRVMIKGALENVLLPQLRKLLQNIVIKSETTKATVMLARTHGQAAIPTTFGKELAVFADRVFRKYQQLKTFSFQGKLSGAVGSYHSFVAADGLRDWPQFSEEFIRSLGLEPVTISTQINPEDDMVELFALFQHLNSILIGLSQDMWRYISDGWLLQQGKVNDVGSSTMPQKINPIEFENSEGNLQVANALFSEFMRSFPISRLQRDLSGSTVKRSLGVAFGHSLLAYKNLTRAMAKLESNQAKMTAELESNWNILSEALQTVARTKGDEQAYEKVAKASKNKVWTKKEWQEIAQEVAPELRELTPATYLGLSVELTQQVLTTIKESDVFIS
ncbi:MAG TPA: adenylosuccinate lyase [Patescibacteria group bacterium]